MASEFASAPVARIGQGHPHADRLLITAPRPYAPDPVYRPPRVCRDEGVEQPVLAGVAPCNPWHCRKIHTFPACAVAGLGASPDCSKHCVPRITS
jgi:hypothetical protein